MAEIEICLAVSEFVDSRFTHFTYEMGGVGCAELMWKINLEYWKDTLLLQDKGIEYLDSVIDELNEFAEMHFKVWNYWIQFSEEDSQGEDLDLAGDGEFMKRCLCYLRVLLTKHSICPQTPQQIHDDLDMMRKTTIQCEW